MLRLLSLQGGPPEDIPEWVPPGVVSLAMWRWDFAEAMQGFGSLYDEANEPGPDGEGLFADMLDALRDDPEGVHIDLRRDVFEQVLPEMLRVSAKQSSLPGDGQPPALQPLFVAPVRDAAKVRDTFTRFYKSDTKVRQTRVGEFDVWTVDKRGSLFVEGESDSVVTVRALSGWRRTTLFQHGRKLADVGIQAGRGARVRGRPELVAALERFKSTARRTAALRSLVRLAECSNRPTTRRSPMNLRTRMPSAPACGAVLLFGTNQASAELPRACSELRPASRCASAGGGRGIARRIRLDDSL